MRFLKSFTTLQWALGTSIAVHATLLTVRLVDPEGFERVFKDTPLEVILVNTRTNEQATKARAIAQTNLNGGGDVEKGRATSPLPPALVDSLGDAPEDASQSQLQNLQEQQNLMLAQMKDQLAALPPFNPNQLNATQADIEREEKRRQLMRMLAEIERNVQAQNARPRKHYISPSTREEAYAVYVDRLRRAIEDKGTNNFPQAGGKKIYGELNMEITINYNGNIIDTKLLESSGNRMLDRWAAAIARNAGPFGPFTQAMRARTEQLVMSTRFKFTHEETLEAQASSTP